MIDVVKITCIQDGCGKSQRFNFEGETKLLYCYIHKKKDITKPLYCTIHKKDMINVKNKTCLEVGCKVTPCFNFEGETTPLYCVIFSFIYNIM